MMVQRILMFIVDLIIVLEKSLRRLLLVGLRML